RSFSLHSVSSGSVRAPGCCRAAASWWATRAGPRSAQSASSAGWRWAGSRSGAAGLEPALPGRLVASGRHVVAVADRGQSKESGRGEEALHDLGVVEPHVTETALSVGVRRL